MAELLRDEDSTDRHLDMARRHQRRCRGTPGAVELAQAIEPSRTALAAAQKAAHEAEDAEEDAEDDLELAGIVGADAVRNLSGAAKEHDRNHPGENIHERVIGDGFGDYIRGDGTIGPDTLDTLGAKVAGLGSGHPFAARAAELAKSAQTIRAAEISAKEAKTKRALAAAAEEVAQAALRRAYESNYLDGRKKLGREAVERLFVRTRRRKKASGGGGGAGGTGNAPS